MSRPCGCGGDLCTSSPLIQTKTDGSSFSISLATMDCSGFSLSLCVSTSGLLWAATAPRASGSHCLLSSNVMAMANAM